MTRRSGVHTLRRWAQPRRGFNRWKLLAAGSHGAWIPISFRQQLP